MSDNDFFTMALEQEIRAPADVAWSKIGGFSAIDKWLDAKCTYMTGSGDTGTVRRVEMGPMAFEEVMVAKTPLSYTYTCENAGVPFYFATVAAVPTAKDTSKIVYTFLWDRKSLSAEEQKQACDIRRQIFVPALQRMKAAVES